MTVWRLAFAWRLAAQEIGAQRRLTIAALHHFWLEAVLARRERQARQSASDDEDAIALHEGLQPAGSPLCGKTEPIAVAFTVANLASRRYRSREPEPV